MVDLWRWQMTPVELFAGFKFIKSDRVTLKLVTQPFRAEVPKAPLPGTPFVFQLALAQRSVAAEVRGIWDAQPELPRVPGRTTGVLVWCGDEIIGSLTIDGLRYNGAYEMFVKPEYRMGAEKGGHKLAYRMLLEWCDATVRPLKEVPYQGITLPSTKALLSVHRSIVDRALAAGKPVPERVLTAIDRGEEAAQILERARYVENL